MELYSIGTVVKLKNGEHKLIIIGRTPLTNNNGDIGYYDRGMIIPGRASGFNNILFQ